MQGQASGGADDEAVQVAAGKKTKRARAPTAKQKRILKGRRLCQAAQAARLRKKEGPEAPGEQRAGNNHKSPSVARGGSFAVGGLSHDPPPTAMTTSSSPSHPPMTSRDGSLRRHKSLTAAAATDMGAATLPPVPSAPLETASESAAPEEQAHQAVGIGPAGHPQPLDAPEEPLAPKDQQQVPRISGPQQHAAVTDGSKGCRLPSNRTGSRSNVGPCQGFPFHGLESMVRILENNVATALRRADPSVPSQLVWEVAEGGRFRLRAPKCTKECTKEVFRGRTCRSTCCMSCRRLKAELCSIQTKLERQQQNGERALLLNPALQLNIAIARSLKPLQYS